MSWPVNPRQPAASWRRNLLHLRKRRLSEIYHEKPHEKSWKKPTEKTTCGKVWYILVSIFHRLRWCTELPSLTFSGWCFRFLRYIHGQTLAKPLTPWPRVKVFNLILLAVNHTSRCLERILLSLGSFLFWHSMNPMRQRQRGAKGFGGAKDEHSEAHFALKTFPQRNLQWDANQTISIPVCVCVFSPCFSPLKVRISRCQISGG